jgi:hypothetical protein
MLLAGNGRRQVGEWAAPSGLPPAQTIHPASPAHSRGQQLQEVQ